MPPLTIDSLKDYLCELGHVIYSYPRMLEHLVLNDGMTYEEAAEFIDYNTIGSLPYMGVPRLRSVILSGAQRSRRIQTSNVLQDRGPGRAILASLTAAQPQVAGGLTRIRHKNAQISEDLNIFICF